MLRKHNYRIVMQLLAYYIERFNGCVIVLLGHYAVQPSERASRLVRISSRALAGYNQNRAGLFKNCLLSIAAKIMEIGPVDL